MTRMPLRALVFDFDGVILDTEAGVFTSWREIFDEHGEQLSLDWWLTDVMGTAEHVDVLDVLERRLGRRLADRDAIGARRRARRQALLDALAPLAGVEDLITAAVDAGVPLAVASSSSRRWVQGHLEHHGLLGHFDVLRCGDEVEHGKPAPDLFRAAVAALGVEPRHAVAIEDSPNGIRAARAAGLRVVAVPHALTAHLTFEDADLVVDSLADVSLADLGELTSRV